MAKDNSPKPAASAESKKGKSDKSAESSQNAKQAKAPDANIKEKSSQSLKNLSESKTESQISKKHSFLGGILKKKDKKATPEPEEERSNRSVSIKGDPKQSPSTAPPVAPQKYTGPPVPSQNYAGPPVPPQAGPPVPPQAGPPVPPQAGPPVPPQAAAQQSSSPPVQHHNVPVPGGYTQGPYPPKGSTSGSNMSNKSNASGSQGSNLRRTPSAEKRPTYRVYSGTSNTSLGGLDSAYDFLVDTKSNNVDSLVNWIKEAGIITNQEEGRTRYHFSNNAPNPNNVTIDQFRAVLFMIAADKRKQEPEVELRLRQNVPHKSLKDKIKHCIKRKSREPSPAPSIIHVTVNEQAQECYFHNLCKTGKSLDKLFDELQKEGKDNVESIVKFLKDTTIMDTFHSTEENVRALLRDVKDGKVDRERFNQLMMAIGSGEDTARPPTLGSRTQCYYHRFCRLAYALEGAMENLYRSGKHSLGDFVGFLQETTIMDSVLQKIANKPLPAEPRRDIPIVLVPTQPPGSQ